MKVADLMTRDVRFCSTNDSLNAAARLMWDHDCGSALVVDAHGKLAGVVTDRDICMAAYTQGLPLGEIPVERVMSTKVISCSRTDEVNDAHRLMRTHEIHRLPVVDTRGKPVGILSLGDIANHWQGDRSEAQAVEIATTVSAIRRRRVIAAASANGNSPLNGEPAKPPRKRRARAAKSPDA